MKERIRAFLELIDHLARLVPGRFVGIVAFDDCRYEVWADDTITLYPYIG